MQTGPSDTSVQPTTPARESLLTVTRRGITALGEPAVYAIRYLGGASGLVLETGKWIWCSTIQRQTRFGRPALYSQLVRLGVRAIGVILLVNCCIGLILALQMAPPLDEFGQVETVANIIAVAVFRELGPLITAIVLTGIGGAAIAAELGTMVVGEEIEALEVHALNPIRFLVMPRMIAVTISLAVLCIIGELIAVGAGWWTGVFVLDIPSTIYIDNTIEQLKLSDFFTGIIKAGLFGLLIGMIACYNGLSVMGGASGVGRATTNTVVHSIVTIIFADLIFTSIFYRLGWT